MPRKLNTTPLLGEDAGPRFLRAPSFREVALGLVGDDRSPWERAADEFERRLHAAMRSPKRTHGTPHL